MMLLLKTIQKIFYISDKKKFKFINIFCAYLIITIFIIVIFSIPANDAISFNRNFINSIIVHFSYSFKDLINYSWHEILHKILTVIVDIIFWPLLLILFHDYINKDRGGHLG